MPAAKSAPPASRSPAPSGPKPEPKILFQKFFKSVGPRTYAAQVKEAANGNHFLVLTEGKRDEATGDVRKTRLFVFSEDFPEYFRMLAATAQWIRANPVDPKVAARRKKHWAKKDAEAREAPVNGPATPAAAAATPRGPAKVAPPRSAGRPVRRPARRP